MEKPRLIKSIVSYNCPHCAHGINICFSFIPPSLTWVITEEDMQDNKKKLKEYLNTIIFKSEKEKRETFEWIDSPECVLGADDIPDIVKSIVEEQK